MSTLITFLFLLLRFFSSLRQLQVISNPICNVSVHHLILYLIKIHPQQALHCVCKCSLIGWKLLIHHHIRENFLSYTKLRKAVGSYISCKDNILCYLNGGGHLCAIIIRGAMLVEVLVLVRSPMLDRSQSNELTKGSHWSFRLAWGRRLIRRLYT